MHLFLQRYTFEIFLTKIIRSEVQDWTTVDSQHFANYFGRIKDDASPDSDGTYLILFKDIKNEGDFSPKMYNLLGNK